MSYDVWYFHERMCLLRFPWHCFSLHWRSSHPQKKQNGTWINIFKPHWQKLKSNYHSKFALSALTLLVGRQEHPTCKKLVTRWWHGYLSEVRCRWVALWSSWCNCHPIISCFIKIQKSRMVLSFWCRIIQVALANKWMSPSVTIILSQKFGWTSPLY